MRTDVYLLGACLHELITGERRHHGTSVAEVLEAARASQPVVYDVSVPAELAALANSATAVDPGERPATVEDFRRLLAAFLTHQSSRRATARAQQRLAELRALGQDGAPTDQLRVFAECRFGFQHALDEWPDNRAAQAGLVAALALQAERSLARGVLEVTAVAVAELQERDPAVAAPLAERLHTAQRAEAARRKQVWDEDLSVSSRQRTAWLMVAGGCALVICVAVLYTQYVVGLDYSHEASIRATWFSMGVLGVSTLIGARWLLRNAANRRLIVVFWVMGFVILGHRYVAQSLGLSVHQMLADDALLIGGMGMVISVYLRRWVAVAALPWCATAGAIVVRPDAAVALFGWATTLSLVIAPVAWAVSRWLQRRVA